MFEWLPNTAKGFMALILKRLKYFLHTYKVDLDTMFFIKTLSH